MAASTVRRPAHLSPAEDDRLYELPARRVRWNLVLVWFMRIAAVFWLAKGLGVWAAILGASPVVPPFEARAIGHQTVMVYFAVIDLVAAVGFWLVANWGGVLWLLAVVSHLILAIFFPRFVPNSTLLIAMLIVFTMLYLTFSWLAAIDE